MRVFVNADKAREIYNEQQRQAREHAFSGEYGVLLGKAARGEATQQDLIDKAAEIRERFPYRD